MTTTKLIPRRVCHLVVRVVTSHTVHNVAEAAITVASVAGPLSGAQVVR